MSRISIQQNIPHRLGQLWFWRRLSVLFSLTACLGLLPNCLRTSSYSTTASCGTAVKAGRFLSPTLPHLHGVPHPSFTRWFWRFVAAGGFLSAYRTTFLMTRSQHSWPKAFPIREHESHRWISPHSP